MGTAWTPRLGWAGLCALAFGLFYAVLAVAEGSSQGRSVPGVSYTPVLNAFHWTLAGCLLVSSTRERLARIVVRTTGVILLIMSVVGLAAKDALGAVLGTDGPQPDSYLVVRAGVALMLLAVGFLVPGSETR